MYIQSGVYRYVAGERGREGERVRVLERARDPLTRLWVMMCGAGRSETSRSTRQSISAFGDGKSKFAPETWL